MNSGQLVVVYQMAKVASRAWVEAAAEKSGAAPVHAHYLTEANLQAIAAILSSQAENNTIVNPLIARDIVRKGRKAIARIEAARERRQEIRVVTGMRDPVARSLSLLSFLADFCGHTGGNLSARDGAAADAVCAALGELWQWVLAGTEPTGSFERLAWRMIGAYRTWFDEELRTVFGLDIFSSPFPSGEGVQRLNGPGVALLAYRAEDMMPEASTRQGLHDAAKRFLGDPNFALPEVNTAATRRSYPLYVQTRERFRLPVATLNAIYDIPAVTHFYRRQEIAEFKARWSLRRSE